MESSLPCFCKALGTIFGDETPLRRILIKMSTIFSKNIVFSADLCYNGTGKVSFSILLSYKDRIGNTGWLSEV